MRSRTQESVSHPRKPPDNPLSPVGNLRTLEAVPSPGQAMHKQPEPGSASQYQPSLLSRVHHPAKSYASYWHPPPGEHNDRFPHMWTALCRDPHRHWIAHTEQSRPGAEPPQAARPSPRKPLFLSLPLNPPLARSQRFIPHSQTLNHLRRKTLVRIPLWRSTL